MNATHVDCSRCGLRLSGTTAPRLPCLYCGWAGPPPDSVPLRSEAPYRLSPVRRRETPRPPPLRRGEAVAA